MIRLKGPEDEYLVENVCFNFFFYNFDSLAKKYL